MRLQETYAGHARNATAWLTPLKYDPCSIAKFRNLILKLRGALIFMSIGDRVSRQCAEAVLMVRPASFAYNRETAPSNSFQRPEREGIGIAARAVAELDRVAAAIAAAGVAVCVAEDRPEPAKPDAVFPNNWVSWHRDGTVVLYPMLAGNRRAERRADVIELVEQQIPFKGRRLLDLSHHEDKGRFLEGTGSLVLDHVRRLAFACRSPRTDESLVLEWARLMDYEPVVFDAHTAGGAPIYHTNVMLAIGSRSVVVCAEAVAVADRERLLERLGGSEQELILINHAAMQAFGANVLELAVSAPSGGDSSVLLMSETAATALRAEPAAWARLTGCVDRVLELAVPTIERIGGGGVRCMLAEVPTVVA
jgi:hypothetical protein